MAVKKVTKSAAALEMTIRSEVLSLRTCPPDLTLRVKRVGQSWEVFTSAPCNRIDQQFLSDVTHIAADLRGRFELED